MRTESGTDFPQNRQGIRDGKLKEIAHSGKSRKERALDSRILGQRGVNFEKLQRHGILHTGKGIPDSGMMNNRGEKIIIRRHEQDGLRRVGRGEESETLPFRAKGFWIGNQIGKLEEQVFADAAKAGGSVRREKICGCKRRTVCRVC